MYTFAMSNKVYRITKGLFFLAAFAMIATLSQGMSAFLLFSSLLMILTLGRSIPLLACLAVLLGATFPLVGAVVAGALIIAVMLQPTQRVLRRTMQPSPPQRQTEVAGP